MWVRDTTPTGNQRPSERPPFVEGQHGTREDCLIYYGNHFRGSGLTREAWELRGHNLWCSYLRAEPCVVDELIAAVYEE